MRLMLAQFAQASETGLGGLDDAAVAKVNAGQMGVRLPAEG